MAMASSSSSSIQKTETTSSMEKEQLKHFSHEHVLRLVQLQPDHDFDNKDEDEDEDGDEDEDNIVVPEDCRVGSCEMCEEDIYSFDLCYYSCKDCDYSLHTFCAQLPATQQNHHLHPGHNLILSKNFVLLNDPSLKFFYKVNLDEWQCTICELEHIMFYGYRCSTCFFHMDIICATLSERKMDHPSHPAHQLQRCSRMISISRCNACGKEHSGTFYHCTTCSCFMINLHCAVLPSKLLIQQSTNGSFSHAHLLTLTYSFPLTEVKAKFFPQCRVCDKYFFFEKWHYRCDKCRFYVHVDCATLPRDAFMSSILMSAGLGKTSKNFKDDDHPNLIHCPFPDESSNLLKHLFINKGELNIKSKIDGEMFSHPHPLIRFETLHNGHVSLHDPMKQVELLCDGCVRPIMDLPFYKCSQDECGFVLHEWCTRLPTEIHNHNGHPNHTLVLKFGDSFNVFMCDICKLYSNGFTYGCMQCEYFVDINCAFIPSVITHEAHADHLLHRIEASPNLSERQCRACRGYSPSVTQPWWFHCPTCDFYLHTKCALLLPGKIRHKYDKHSLSLRYYPAENHSSAYFCEICEDELNPKRWFYHCSTCASSMHTACAPLKHHCERSILPINYPVFWFLNVKFGRTLKITNHPHPLTYVQGISADEKCDVCHKELQFYMIFKCSQCKVALHIWCV